MSNNTDGSLWLLAIVAYFIFSPASKEQTIYQIGCSGEVANDVCKGHEIPGPRITYRINEEAQSVVYWVGSSSPRQYKDCAIRDRENWACVRINDFSYQENMVDGVRPELDGWGFHQVSKWRWWYVWGRDKIRSEATT